MITNGRIMPSSSWSRKWQWYITFPVCLASLPATVTIVFARTVMVSFQPASSGRTGSTAPRVIGLVVPPVAKSMPPASIELMSTSTQFAATSKHHIDDGPLLPGVGCRKECGGVFECRADTAQGSQATGHRDLHDSIAGFDTGFDTVPDVLHLPKLRHHTGFVVGGQDESLNGVGGYVCRREASEVAGQHRRYPLRRLPAFRDPEFHHLGMRDVGRGHGGTRWLSGDGVDELEPLPRVGAEIDDDVGSFGGRSESVSIGRGVSSSPRSVPMRVIAPRTGGAGLAVDHDEPVGPVGRDVTTRNR
jgi:hypothetical protein